MKFILTIIHPDILEAGHAERDALTDSVDDAITNALELMKLRGLSKVEANWFHSSRDNVRESEVRNIRYSKKKGTVTCQFILPPEVPPKSKRWAAYCVSYVEQAAKLMDEFFAGVSQRLKKNGYDGDLEEAHKAVSHALKKVRKRYSS